MLHALPLQPGFGTQWGTINYTCGVDENKKYSKFMRFACANYRSKGMPLAKKYPFILPFQQVKRLVESVLKRHNNVRF